MNKRKNWILVGLAITAFLDGSVGQYMASGDPFPASSILFLLATVTLSFMWYYFDSEQIGYRRGKLLNIGIVALGIIAFPYYFFHSRGFRKGLKYTALFFVVVIAWSVLQAIGIYVIASGSTTPQTLMDVHVLQQEKVISDATRRIERDPNDAVAYYDRGMAYLEIGQYNNFEAYVERGDADLENVKLNNAIEDFSKAIKLNPNYARAYEGRADAYVFTNRPQDAITDLGKAEELDPTIFTDDKNRGFGYLSETTKEFVFPVVADDKRHREGNVILGSTTLDQVVGMLPAWPGHGPTLLPEQDKVHESGKIGEVIKRSQYSYNPMVAGNHIFVFDKEKRLIFIRVHVDRYVFPEGDIDLLIQKRIAEMMRKNNFVEVSRDEMFITMRGEIMPCVIAETIGHLNDDKSVFAIEYYFTCPTKN